MLVLDSDVCIDVMRLRPNAISWFQKQTATQMAVPAIVAAELLYGGYRRETRTLQTTLDFLEPLNILPFDRRAAEHYGVLRVTLERSGNIVGPHDMFIAATALAHDATLITRNRREFIRIPGLRLKSWED